jgi:hypothetical protein
VNPVSRGTFTTLNHVFAWRPDTPLSPENSSAEQGSPGPVTWNGRNRGQGATQVDGDLFPGFWEGTPPEGRFRVTNVTDPAEAVSDFGVEHAEIYNTAGDTIEVRCEVTGRASEPDTTVAVP